MGLMRRLEPRRFDYIPRFYKPEPGDGKRFKFRRATLYDPHRAMGRPAVLIALMVLVVGIILILGGVGRSVKLPLITADDAVTVEP